MMTAVDPKGAKHSRANSSCHGWKKLRLKRTWINSNPKTTDAEITPVCSFFNLDFVISFCKCFNVTNYWKNRFETRSSDCFVPNIIFSENLSFNTVARIKWYKIISHTF